MRRENNHMREAYAEYSARSAPLTVARFFCSVIRMAYSYALEHNTETRRVEFMQRAASECTYDADGETEFRERVHRAYPGRRWTRDEWRELFRHRQTILERPSRIK